MPPRFAYWTIIAGGLPTSFRAAEKDELMPTFRRIQGKHPDAVMKYFARGKLWESPAEARHAARSDERPAEYKRRGRDWRPGGEHRDPRQPAKDAKKRRNQDRRHQRWQQSAAFRTSANRRFERGQERPPEQPPPPTREPVPEREPKPEPPPRPSEPTIRPPGPPERGRGRPRGGSRDKRRRQR